MKKYTLYLFDFDGTLFDTCDSLKEIYRLTFAKYGIVPKENEYSYFLGMSLSRCRAYKGVKKRDEQEFIDCFNKFVMAKKVLKMTKLYPETLKLFNYLNKHKIHYGIVSGSSSKRVLDVLKYFKIDTSHLEVCIGNDNCGKPKPNPDPILIALEKTGLLKRRKEVIYIGDAKQDEETAKAANVDYLEIKRPYNHGALKSLLDLFK